MLGRFGISQWGMADPIKCEKKKRQWLWTVVAVAVMAVVLLVS